VGINAYGGSNELSGCVNDALDWKAELEQRGFQVSTLLDQKATGDNIRSALRQAMARGARGDSFVFTYSGHGTYLTDVSGDEPDRKDEAICPVDCFTNGMLVDDELANILGTRRYGVKVAVISDSCHSGTLSRFLDLTPGRGKARVIPETQFTYTARAKTPRPLRTLRSRVYPFLLLAGCMDEEYSYDAHFAGRANGAFSRVALDTLRSKPKSYLRWYRDIRSHLPNEDYPQSPQLDASIYRQGWAPLS
jgi:hypothetical protein